MFTRIFANVKNVQEQGAVAAPCPPGQTVSINLARSLGSFLLPEPQGCPQVRGRRHEISEQRVRSLRFIFCMNMGHYFCFACIRYAQNKGGVVISLTFANDTFDGDRKDCMSRKCHGVTHVSSHQITRVSPGQDLLSAYG